MARSSTVAVTVLSPRGVLDLAQGHQLRLAVQTEFAFSTRPLVCDLGAVTEIDLGAVGLLHAASESCGGWPMVHLAVAAPRPDVARRLRRSGASRFLVLRDTLALAERDVLSRPPKLRGRLELAPGLGAMVAARRFVGDCCLRWRMPELMAPAADATVAVLRTADAYGRLPMRLTVDAQGTRLSVCLDLRAPSRAPAVGEDGVRVELRDGVVRLSTTVSSAAAP